MNVNYVKEPGFIYDLISMITIALNKDFYFSELKRNNKGSEEDFLFYENIINQCRKISDDILPFFYIEKNNPCFLSTFYLLGEKNIRNFSINELISDLS
ncbi:MAG: hypothetical protein K0S55_1813, partial [Clostridia bacterium]|nr:hypothetical protein [Clostridia bacterium]